MDTLPAPIVYGNTELVVPAQGRKQDSMLHWVTEYWETRVLGSPAGTTRGKRDDLQLFLSFFTNVVASDYVDDWTPSLSKAFKAWLQNADPKPPRKHEKAYAPSSINRMLATLRHFAKFIQESRKFEAGFPFEGVKDALEYVTQAERKIVLIDGERLVKLMIEHHVGVTPYRSFVLKRLDSDYFEET